MMRRTRVYLVLLYSWMMVGIPIVSVAAGPPSPPSDLAIGTPPPPPPPLSPPPTPLGSDSLLPGMTPGNYRLPSGWSLVRAQDFEGTKPEGETWGSWNGVVNTVRPHSGSKSIEGSYQNDQADAKWILNYASVGTFTEVYVSYYEYIESQALFNDEFFLANFYRHNPFQEIVLDWFWARDANNNPAFNGPKATIYVVPQGVKYGRHAAKTATVPKGAWVQWELHYRPNTSGAKDGFYRVYKDGTLFTSVEDVDLNGTATMSGATTIQVGGVYTKLVWMMDSPTCTECSSAPGKGTDYCTASKQWSGQSFSSPRCAPVDPPLQPFKRYYDDIIVMKK